MRMKNFWVCPKVEEVSITTITEAGGGRVEDRLDGSSS